MNPLKWFMGRGARNSSRGERTVVRPTYSYLGNYNISDRVITDIINHICIKSGFVFKVNKMSVYKTKAGIKVKVFLIMYDGRNIIEAAEKIQREIVKEIEMMTAFNVENTDIEIRGLKQLIKEVKDFNLKHIFDCGQCFRWEEEADGSYTGTAFGKTVNMRLEREADGACCAGKRRQSRRRF